MHEIGYCESLLPAVEKRAQGRPVASIGVRAGVSHRLVPDVFQQAFDMVATGGVAEGATTELVQVPVRVTCRDCGEKAEVEDALAACPSCGSDDLTREGGDEFVLEWLRYREEAPA